MPRKRGFGLAVIWAAVQAKGSVPALSRYAVADKDGRDGPGTESLISPLVGEIGSFGAYPTIPTRLWLPSQNGLLAEWPQRQRKTLVVRATVWPVPVTISALPSTLSGPLTVGVTLSGPSRTSRTCASFNGGSPVAEKPALIWLLSQNGLFCDKPQRQSVAR